MKEFKMIVYINELYGEIKREFYSLTPNGNKMNGRWVYRDNQKRLIDFNFNRNDLFERNNIKIK